MRTIETTGITANDHTLTVRLPEEVPAGRTCRVVVTVTDDRPAAGTDFMAGWTTFDVQLTDPGDTFRRESLYGDDQ